MKTYLAPRSFSALASLCFLVACSAEPAAESVAIDMTQSGQEGSCIMVFGVVGERFEYVVGDGAGSKGPESCREGVDAFGSANALPQGLSFDAGSAALTGVPQQAGFHEFVAQVMENGIVSERVILIDIEDRSAQRSLGSYAGLFFGDIR